ncbi:hypothetical protein HAX54_050183, partial [Datura stramonium]|nr:hypothetical protein [Datura stramonium]
DYLNEESPPNDLSCVRAPFYAITLLKLAYITRFEQGLKLPRKKGVKHLSRFTNVVSSQIH